jgi:hypothetical protein
MFVRGAAASSLEAITGKDLVAGIYELDPSIPDSVYGDEPEGIITEKARTWWMEEGRFLNWSEDTDSCGPPSS